MGRVSRVQSTRPEPPMEETPASARRAAVLLGALIALTVVGSSAVAVAIPVVRADLDLTVSDAAWIFSVFSLSMSVATAVFGRVADIFGLRRPLVVGVLVMALGAAIAASAPSLPILLGGRVLQGIGSGAVPVLANGIVAARWTGAARSAVFGSLFAVVSAVSGAGPIIGGGVETVLGWRWVIAIPVVAVLLIRPIVPLAPNTVRGGSFDGRGAALVSTLVSGVMLLLQSPTAGAAAGTVGAGLLLVSLPLLWRHTRRAPDGFLPHAVIGNPSIRAASIGGLVLLGGYFAALLAVPSLLAETQGWSSLAIGLAMLPAAAAGAVGSRVVGRLLARGGHFRIASGVAAGSVACLLLAGFGGGSPWLLVLGVAGASIGFSGGSVALNDRVTLAADDSFLGVALGMVNMVQFVGGAIGTALLGGLSGLVALHTALGLAAALPALGLVVLVRAARRDAADPSPSPIAA